LVKLLRRPYALSLAASRFNSSGDEDRALVVDVEAAVLVVSRGILGKSGGSGASGGIFSLEMFRRRSDRPTMAPGWSWKCDKAFSYWKIAS
jgi:hypothetical protein